MLQEHTYKRVGGGAWARSDFRLVSATNRDLLEDQRQGRFRSDLYHRIASGVVRLPPLRERTEDVDALIAHFLGDALGADHVAVTRPVQRLLRQREFPGNLRELRQLATAAAARHPDNGPITPGDIPPSERPCCAVTPRAQASRLLSQAVRRCLETGMSLSDLKKAVADVAVDIALTDCDGNACAAATMLGVTDRAVHLRKRERQSAMD